MTAQTKPAAELVRWICDCGAPNEDVPAETAVPICELCDKEWPWDELSTRIGGAK